ncbi:MAG: PilZ domain-containing protein [Byssovorax sp.]
MERRISSRAQVDLPVAALIDGFRHECRAVDLSPGGMVFLRSRGLRARELSQINPFEIHLDIGRIIPARARSVWCKDGFQAVRFVWMHDVDRLEIAEHLDRVARRSGLLH